MDVQNASNLTISNGTVKALHDDRNGMLWGSLDYNTTYGGRTEQLTSIGENLLDYTDVYSKDSGAVLDNDGWVTMTLDNSSGSSTAYCTYYIKALPLSASTDYNAILEVKSATGPISFWATSSNSTSQFTASWRINYGSLCRDTTYSNILTTKDDLTDIPISFRTVLQLGAETKGSITFRLSLLSDTTVTPNTFSYQPYTNGTNAPNPDFPQSLQITKGEQVVHILEKNLFDPKLLAQQVEYNTYDATTGLWSSKNYGDYYRSLLYWHSGLSGAMDVTKLIPVEPETEYSIKFYDLTNHTNYANNSWGYAFFDESGVYIESVYGSVATGYASFVTPSDAYYLDIRRVTNSGYFTFSKIALLKGFYLEDDFPDWEADKGHEYAVDLLRYNLFDGDLEVGGISGAGKPLNYTTRFNSVNFMEVEPSTTYTFSAVSKVQDKTVEAVFQAYDANKTFISQIPGDYFSTPPFSITTPADCKFITFSGRYSDNTVFGSVGEPTDAIQEVTVVSDPLQPINDYQLCGVDGYQDCIVKNSGKNLFNPALFDGLEVGTLGGYTTTDYYTDCTAVTLNLQPNTSYQLTVFDLDGNKVTASSVGVSFALNGSWVSVGADGRTITTDNTGSFELNIGASAYANIGKYNFYVQLEEGNVATYYEHHVNDGAGWYLYKVFRKIELDGSEEWSTSTMSGYRAFWLSDTGGVQGSANSNPIVSNYFISKYAAELNDILLSNTSVGRILIYVDKDVYTSLEDWQTWLSSHHTTVYYAVASPTMTKITEPILIKQLEKIHKYLTRAGYQYDVYGDLPITINQKALAS